VTDGAPAAPTWPDLLTSLLERRDLDDAEARWAMDQIMGGEASLVQVAGFLVALRAKGVTVTELRGLADVMIEHANTITVPGPTLDIVGTGGDRQHTVNISTMAAIVIAGSGVTVVKHGNRAASSSSGSADVLEALGVDLSLAPERVGQVAVEAGITFCFAQAFHPSMRHAGPARAGLAIPTVFNFLGPLTNPARPTSAAVGVADARMAPLMAGVFADRGSRAVVFRGDDGLDELTVADSSTLWWVDSGTVQEFTLSPEDVGVGRHPLSALRGADAAYNAAVARALLEGGQGAVRDAVVLNAGAALACASGASVTDRDDLVRAVRTGVVKAGEAIDSGDAAAALDRWVAATRGHQA